MADPESPIGARPKRASSLSSIGLAPRDVGLSLVAVLLVIGYVPALLFDNWTLRMGLLALCGFPGLILLVRDARRRDRAAMALVSFCAWSLVVSVSGGAARSSVIGDVGREISWISVALASGLWSLGRRVSERGSALVTAAILAAVAAGSLIGIAQTAFVVDSGPLALYFGRPTGLLVNPVFFGAVAAAGAAIGAASARPTWHAVGMTVVCAHAAALSGSRVAFGAVVITGLVTLAIGRGSRASLVGVGAAAVGLASGSVLAAVRTPETDIGSRLAAADGGGRGTAWRYGIEAWLDRPLTGYGFGQFRAVTQGRFSAEFAGRFAADERTQAWFDPHNALVNVLVSSGVVGALLVGWWLWSMRHVRGPLTLGVVALTLTWLLQPVGLATLPIAMVILGVASAGDSTLRLAEMERGRARAFLGVGLALGAAAASWLFVADLRLQSAAHSFDTAAAASAARMYPSDPVVADIVAQIAAFDDEAATDVRARWRALPTEYDPSRPLWWIRLAGYQIGSGEYDDAKRSVDRAFDLQPHSVGVIRTGMRLAAAQQDRGAFDVWMERACALSMAECADAP